MRSVAAAAVAAAGGTHHEHPTCCHVYCDVVLDSGRTHTRLNELHHCSAANNQCVVLV